MYLSLTHHKDYLLSRLLSNRLKKTIFLASLAGVISAKSKDEITTVSRINEIFGIGMQPYSLRGPYRIHASIWGSKTIEIRDGCASCEVANQQLLAETILNVTPCWLCYDSRDNMFTDVMRLLEMR